MSPSRATVVDFTSPVKIIAIRVLAGRGDMVIDPWAFLMPFESIVWFGTLVSVMMLPLVMMFFFCFFNDTFDTTRWITVQTDFFGILVQEGKLY